MGTHTQGSIGAQQSKTKDGGGGSGTKVQLLHPMSEGEFQRGPVGAIQGVRAGKEIDMCAAHGSKIPPNSPTMLVVVPPYPVLCCPP